MNKFFGLVFALLFIVAAAIFVKVSFMEGTAPYFMQATTTAKVAWNSIAMGGAMIMLWVSGMIVLKTFRRRVEIGKLNWATSMLAVASLVFAFGVGYFLWA